MSSKAARKPLKVDEADLVPAPKPALPATPDIDDARILAKELRRRERRQWQMAFEAASGELLAVGGVSA